MAELSKIMKLSDFVQISGISLNDHILEDIFEAFIGAFYLNFGMKYTRILIISLIEKHKDLSEFISHDDNYKDLLLRYFHQRKWGHPVYQEEKTIDLKFKSIVNDPDGCRIGFGIASNKKKAEQYASRSALIKLGIIVNGEIDPDWTDKIERVEKEVKEKDKDKIDSNSFKPLSVYNQNNKLLNRTTISLILGTYGIQIPSTVKLHIKIFSEAMTHRSYLVRKNLTADDKEAAKKSVKLQSKSNERLQFLGDAVIHFVIGECLFHRFTDQDEGFLTRLRCKLENKESLFQLAIDTGISQYVLVSQNIEALHGRTNINIIGGGFEAFVGALYLEVGLGLVRKFILEVIRIELDIVKIAENETNYKDVILQLYNKKHWGRPEYRLLKEEGPDHAKVFTMGLFLHNQLMGKGTASSKKKAEQIASMEMYNKYENKTKT